MPPRIARTTPTTMRITPMVSRMGIEATSPTMSRTMPRMIMGSPCWLRSRADAGLVAVLRDRDVHTEQEQRTQNDGQKRGQQGTHRTQVGQVPVLDGDHDPDDQVDHRNDSPAHGVTTPSNASPECSG